MSEKMYAVSKVRRERGAELVEVPIPPVKANEILVKVSATSLCGTDVHIYEWDEWAQKRIKNVPQILGHEFAGEVVEIGKNVTKVKAGDFISAETHIPCEHCKACLTGSMHICENLKIVGVDDNGCFAEYIAIPEIVAWKNDKSIPKDLASLQEPIGNAFYAALVEPVVGKTVFILGDGPAGLFSIIAAKAGGAAKVIISGEEEFRLKIAREVGADVVINRLKESVDEVVFSHTGGAGADVVLEMSGSENALHTGFKVLRKSGRFSAFGIFPSNVKLDINNDIIFKGAKVYGINGRLMFDTWYQVSSLLSQNKINILPVVTHRIPLKEYKKAFELMTAKPRLCGKIILFP